METSFQQEENLSDIVSANATLLRKTLSEILQLFIHSEHDTAINKSLHKLMYFFNVDRVFIGTVNNNDSLSFTHEVYSDESGSIIAFLKNKYNKESFSEQDLPWWIRNVKKRAEMIYPDINEMPSDASIEQNFMIQNKVKSLLVCSIYREGGINGFIGLEIVKYKKDWNKEDIENMHLFADLFSIAIEKELIEKEIKKNAEQTLRQDTIFKLIFEKIPVGIELYDKEGYLIGINPYDLQILGTTKEEIMGVNLFHNPVISLECKNRIREGEEVDFENNYNFRIIQDIEYYNSTYTNTTKRLLGKCVPLRDDDNEIFGYLELVHDNTEYYLKNEQLQSGITKLKMAVNTGKAFFWEYDIKNDVISIDYSLGNETNLWQSFTSSYSTPEPTLLGHLQRLHPDDVDRVYNQLGVPLINGDIDHFTATYRQFINGEYEWLTTNFRTYKYDKDGKPSHIICYSSNVTQQRKNEIELIEIKEADKLKNAFIENMSHEIRTPLNAIIGFSNVIADLNPSEENIHFIELINQNSEHLLRLVDDMLDFSKIESNRLEYNFNYCDIKEVCTEIIESEKLRLGFDVSLIFDNTLPSIIIHSDKKRIKQVIYQLIDNAIKFTSQGTIILSYKPITVLGDILRVEVSDTGIGLSEEEIKKIFSLFYKSDTFQPGVGLGLPLSKKIINDMGGEFGVESQKGIGSTFWFTLPIKII